MLLFIKLRQWAIHQKNKSQTLLCAFILLPYKRDLFLNFYQQDSKWERETLKNLIVFPTMRNVLRIKITFHIHTILQIHARVSPDYHRITKTRKLDFKSVVLTTFSLYYDIERNVLNEFINNFDYTEKYSRLYLQEYHCFKQFVARNY